MCNGQGTCEGAGLKSGSGKCKCNTGYTGDACESCAAVYAPSGEDSGVCEGAYNPLNRGWGCGWEGGGGGREGGGKGRGGEGSLIRPFL